MKLMMVSTLAALGMLAGQGAFAQASATTVELKAQNNSGQTGSATLTPQGDKTQVVLKLSGAPAGVAQPAHIHDGSCANLDAKPRVPLQSLTNGSSTTVVSMKLDDILKAGGAINVHKSADDLKAYVACGDLKSMK